MQLINGEPLLIRGALSRAEVEALIERAEPLIEDMAGLYPPSYRNNERTIVDDDALAARLLQQLRPHLPETFQLEGETWDLDGINPRLRCCRYRAGQAFRIHRDGVHYCDDGRRSVLTFMVYLNDHTEFGGGHTRFFAGRRDTDAITSEVQPEAGTLIVFDHTLWHDGAPVTRGVKYVLRSDLLYRPRRARRDVGHRGYVWSATPLADGGVATGGRDKTIRLWDRDGRQRDVWREHSASVTALAAADDGTLFSAGRDGRVLRWSPDGEVLARRQLEHAVLDLALARDAWVAGGGLVSVGADGVLRRWSLELTPSTSVRTLPQRPLHDGWIWQVRRAPRGWLTAGEDGTVRRTDGEGVSTVVFRGPHPINAVCPTPDGFITGDTAGTVRSHENGEVRTLAEHHARVRSIVLLPEGLVASGGEDDRVQVTARDTGAAMACFLHNDFVTGLLFHEDSLLSTSYGDGVRRLPWTPVARSARSTPSMRSSKPALGSAPGV